MRKGSRDILFRKWGATRILCWCWEPHMWTKNEGERFSSPYTYRVCYCSYFIPLPSSSLRIRFRKSLTIRGNPSLSGTFGSQFSNSFALLISGFLICGSSAVFGLYSIVALESIVSLTTYNKTISISLHSPKVWSPQLICCVRLLIKQWIKTKCRCPAAYSDRIKVNA